MEAMATFSSLPALFSRPPVRFLASLSIPFLPNRRVVGRRFRNLRFVFTSCSADRVVARPSSEFRRKSSVAGHEDEKLRALRALFSRPGIGIDAYIIPSQDAHQVGISLVFDLQCEFLESQWVIRETWLVGLEESIILGSSLKFFFP